MKFISRSDKKIGKNISKSEKNISELVSQLIEVHTRLIQISWRSCQKVGKREAHEVWKTEEVDMERWRPTSSLLHKVSEILY